MQVLNEGNTRRSDSENVDVGEQLNSPDQSTIRPEGQSLAGGPSEPKEVCLDFLLIISSLMQAQASNGSIDPAHTGGTVVYVGNSRL